MYNDITGIVLCGGKSSRMGTNKAFLKLGGKYIIEIICDLMKCIFGNVILVTNKTELYEFLNLEAHEDIYKGKGTPNEPPVTGHPKTLAGVPLCQPDGLFSARNRRPP